MDDWDGVELGPEAVELALVSARGKWTASATQLRESTTAIFKYT